MDITIAVIGFPHCGTSMLTGILQILGVPMVGERYVEEKLEDIDMLNAFENEDVFRSLVSLRNSQHNIWGFKQAGGYTYIPMMNRHLRNPIYLFILKGLIPVTRRRFCLTSINSPGKFVRALKDTMQNYTNAIKSIRDSKQDVHIFSYEDAIISPTRFVENVIGITNILSSKENINRAIEWIQPNDSFARKPYPKLKI